jgi:DNA-binding NtrC family response regulator
VEFAAENGKEFSGFTPDALDVLSGYDWPGNVRELRNVIERMVVLSRGGKLTVRDLPRELRESPGLGGRSGPGDALSLEHAEKDMIIKALKATDGNKSRAAEHLGISRRTLHRKINEYGLKNV